MQQKTRDKILTILALKQGSHFDVSKDHDVEDIVNRTVFKDITLPDQRNIMQSLQKRQLTRFAVSAVRVPLIDCFFKNHAHLGYLSILELKDCAEISDDLFPFLTQCPLQKLTLKRAKLQKIEEKTGVFSTRPYFFPDLKSLDLTGCSSLKVFSLIAPRLEEVMLKGCDALPMQQLEGIRNIIENSPQLKRITHESLEDLMDGLSEEEDGSGDLIHYAPLVSFLREGFYVKSAKDLLLEGRRFLDTSLNYQKSYLLYRLALKKDVENRTNFLNAPEVSVDYYRELGEFLHQAAEDLPVEEVVEKLKYYDKAIELKEKVIRFSTLPAVIPVSRHVPPIMAQDYRSLAKSWHRSAEILPNERQVEKERRVKKSIELLESVLKSKKITNLREKKEIEKMLRDFKKVIGSCIMGFYVNHYPDIRKALFKVTDDTVMCPIGVDFHTLKDSEATFQFWELGEQERFMQIGLSFLLHARSFIFHFGWEDIGKNIIERYIKQIEEDAHLNSLPKILLGVGNGHPADLTDILKLQEECHIETLIYLPWSKKPYQQSYIRGKVCAITRGDLQKVEEVTAAYEERKKQEEESLKQLALQMQHKVFRVVELFEILSDIDYSDLVDILQEEIQALQETAGLDKSSPPPLLTNIKHLYYVGAMENNQKITDKFQPLIKQTSEGFILEEALVNIYVKGFTPLSRICASGFLPAVQYFVQKDPTLLLEQNNPSDEYPGALAPPTYAVNHIHIIKWLVENKYLPLPLKNAVLFASAERGYQHTAEYILTQGAEMNCTSSDGKTPLYVAASNGHKALSRFLITKGANRECTIKKFNTVEKIDIVKVFSIEE
jgi:tetratricopeptide (TPR) repeat protein